MQGNHSAIFQSVGTIPDLRDKFITCFRGLARTGAASFNIPGGRLSMPVALLRFSLVNSL